MRILTLLALGLTLSAGAAQAHLAQWCMGRVSLESLPLDPRSVSDAQRPWTYAGVFRNHAPTPFRIVVTFVGPSGVTSLANGREVTLEPGRETQIFLVQWPKSMAQPSANTLASATRMICHG
jgi:hypothetical protein